ncbi:FCD domain-containing protein [Paenibacillus baekrokdamisoli]|uniref:FCD domain-containing protein n=1 Tax=Paenibacillus baekrokdamisoli TaxID=1712516 RepID=UPI001E3C20E3|nr:FCD domain-containing protein [Paenibacillus baekrokdamisoli]
MIGTLDALAAALSVDHISDEDLAKMEEIVHKIDTSIKEQSYADYQHYQIEFHNVYLIKCNNDTLIELIKSFQNNFVRQTYLSDNKEKLYTVLEQMNKEHRQIIQLFREKDKTGLEQILKHVHWRIDYTDMI